MLKKLLPVLLGLALLLSACANGAAGTAETQTIYGVVTDISGDTYTLALGERVQQDKTPRLPQKQEVSASAGTSDAAPQNNGAGPSSAGENTQTSSAASVADTLLVRNGTTRTLHITSSAQVSILLGDVAVCADVSRIAVGHVVQLMLEESANSTASVQSVQIIG